MRNGTTVFVVDDDDAVRDSLRWTIESAGYQVEAYPTAQEFLQKYHPAQIGCLVLDMRMPGMSGMELQKQLVARNAQLGIIFITAHATVPAAVQAMRAGAIDFITKPFDDQTLLNRVQRCMERARAREQEHAQNADLAGRLAQLTPREHEIMRDVIAGKSNKVIAAERNISSKTVEAHRAKVMQKLGAKSLAHLMRMVLPREDLRGKP